MNETWIMVLLTGGPLLWMLGGTFNKAWRRIAWPIVAGGAVAISGHAIQGVLICAALALVNSLPYGDRTPWLMKVAVFLALASPGLLINVSAWPIVILTGALISLMALATRKVNFFTHKLFEFGAGAIQAGVIVLAALK